MYSPGQKEETASLVTECRREARRIGASCIQEIASKSSHHPGSTHSASPISPHSPAVNYLHVSSPQLYSLPPVSPSSIYSRELKHETVRDLSRETVLKEVCEISAIEESDEDEGSREGKKEGEDKGRGGLQLDCEAMREVRMAESSSKFIDSPTLFATSPSAHEKEVEAEVIAALQKNELKLDLFMNGELSERKNGYQFSSYVDALIRIFEDNPSVDEHRRQHSLETSPTLSIFVTVDSVETYQFLLHHLQPLFDGHLLTTFDPSSGIIENASAVKVYLVGDQVTFVVNKNQERWVFEIDSEE